MYRIHTQAGEFFPVRVTFLRERDGYVSESRCFRNLEDAERWIEFMESIE